MRYRPIRNRWPQRMAQRTRAEKNPYKYLGRLWRLELFGSNTSVSGWPSPAILPLSLSFPPFCQGENESTIPTRRVLGLPVLRHPIPSLPPGSHNCIPARLFDIRQNNTSFSTYMGAARQQKQGRIPQLLFCPLTRRDSLSARSLPGSQSMCQARLTGHHWRPQSSVLGPPQITIPRRSLAATLHLSFCSA